MIYLEKWLEFFFVDDYLQELERCGAVKKGGILKGEVEGCSRHGDPPSATRPFTFTCLFHIYFFWHPT